MAKRDENGRFVKGSEPICPFPKGNQYSDKYREEYAVDIVEFFSRDPIEVVEVDGVPRQKPCVYPTVERWAATIGVTTETVRAWAERYEGFKVAYHNALQMQKDILITNALTGGYNAQFAKFLATCTHGMVERTAVDVGNDGDKAFKVDITVVD